ncbi:glycerate kinase [Candidatus Sumerlaeota bacterium]|nr:glycerate kinase [Candidatus Sumerlaeota bacterium]
MSRVIVIAPDSFKECLRAAEVAAAIRRGVLAAIPTAEVLCLPMADGGEGFVEALIAEGRGERRTARVTGPLGEPVEATWGMLAPGCTAVIEMAQAAGLERVAEAHRDPECTTTFGVGELLLAAQREGARETLIGVGGSATNDGGIGMAQALGYRFLDERGEEIAVPAGGGELIRVSGIRPPTEPLGLGSVRVACDVDNPLLGERGAARVYAAQKGAAPDQIEALEAGMARFADAIERDLGMDVRSLPGSGAAGGLGAGLVAFAGARLEPGAALVLEALQLEAHLGRASLVITGEGAINAQTLSGKAPWEVYRRSQTHGVPVLMLGGDIARAPEELRGAPGLRLRAIAPEGTSRAESMARASELLEASVREFLGEAAV